MGFFSCCMSDRKQSHNESEVRRARIVEIYTQAAYDAQAPTSTPPPSYNETIRESNVHGVPTITEKEPYQPPAGTLPPQSSPPPSPRTSICSVPSTRLTDLTSVPTGATGVIAGNPRNDESLRSSLVFDSAPPSYYDGRSIRERSRSPDGQRRLEEQHHPVTTEDWLEVLQRTAQAADNYIRRLETT